MNKKGNILLVSLIIIAAVIVGGVALFSSNKKPEKTGVTEGMMQSSYTGQKLAGLKAQYLAFTKDDYDKALAEDKIIFLDFYANWCPICRAEETDILLGFNRLDSGKVVGFRVNFNDTETNEDEKALAKQFDIPYQHYKVILKKGREVLKSGEAWNMDTFIQEMNKQLL